MIETDGTNDALVTSSGTLSQGYAIDVYGMQGPYAGSVNGVNINPTTSSSSSAAPTVSTTRHSKRHPRQDDEPTPEPTLMPSLSGWTRSPSPTAKPTSWWWGPWH